MQTIADLIAGYRRFYRNYFVRDNRLYQKLAKEGQSPRAVVIACSDSRADPAIITRAKPGELFVIRNVANLVPPYQPDHTYHSTSAALEFAINALDIEHVIVFGHSQCAGIRALLHGSGAAPAQEESFMAPWMEIAAGARQAVLHTHAHETAEKQAELCGRKAIELSLKNLETFPWIAEKAARGALLLHGWHFDIDSGALLAFDRATGEWGAAA